MKVKGKLDWLFVPKSIGLFLGPLLFIFLNFIYSPINISPEATHVLAIAAWMITWWISEAVPIPITALLPLVAFPLLGVFEIKSSTAPYASPIVFLFMGGFIIALGMEKWNLHKRIALNLIRITGTDANGIILGFMIATAFLSMWISNTATTVMMLPIAMSVIELLKDDQLPKKQFKNFALTLTLAIAYAANIGGTATIIGTPPNIVLVGFMKELEGVNIDFSQWMLIGIPVCITMLTLTYFLLTRVIYPNRLGNFAASKNVIQEQLKSLGSFSKEEKAVTIVFICTASLWMFRATINKLMGFNFLNDTIIAMIGGISMFLIPLSLKEGKFLMDWETMKKMPWDILILFGGGLCLARGMETTGLIEWLGEKISAYAGLNTFLLIFLLTATVLFMTELMSNVALITIFIPVIIAIANGLNIPTLLIAIPATLASSFAFMMPISTPPNAIVFASGHIRMKDMAKAGFWLNLISISVLTAGAMSLFQWVF